MRVICDQAWEPLLSDGARIYVSRKKYFSRPICFRALDLYWWGGGRWPSGLERWTGDRTVQGSNPTVPFTPPLVSFGGDTKSRRSLLSGVYARGSKRSHQSALECVTVVDSTAHSKLPQKCVYVAENAALH